MTQDDQLMRIDAYATFDPTVVHANCENCGCQIPVALRLCADCTWDDEDNQEPDHDDSVRCCPDCERPNQFGEICAACERERQIGIAENRL